MSSDVSLVKCADYLPANVTCAVNKAVDLLGGLRKFIKPKSRVLVKPNLLMISHPEAGICTHPEVVRAVIKLLKGIDCEVIVGDGPSVWMEQIQNLDKIFEVSGMRKVCDEEGARLVDFNKRRMREKFPLTTWLDECDHLVSVPKFKTHGLTLLTGAVKNLFGLVSGTYKLELHKRYFDSDDFAGILTDILKEAKPSLTIIDGITAMEGDGPGTSGKLRDENLIAAGADCVALDSVLALIMGVKPLDVPTTRLAARNGLGQADINKINILGEKVDDVSGRPFLLPAASMTRRIPRPLINIAKGLLRHYPIVLHEVCTRCATCLKTCPAKAISFKDERIVFDYRKCISCFCCQEICPASAIRVKKSLLAKFMGL